MSPREEDFMTYHRELERALEIAQKAGDLALSYFSRATVTEEKDDFSPVTVADRECEQLISRLLCESYADDGIVGEEGAFRASRSGRRWFIDPIDGTRDFVRRNPFWAIQLALQDENRMVLGLINFPSLNQVLYAEEGSGCFWNGVRTSASDISRLDKAILMVSGFKSAWESWTPESVRFLTEQCWTVRCYGGCYDVAMLARGKADIWLSGSGMEWDYAPVQIIAKECGASFLTKEGNNRIDARHCVVCVPGIEGEIRRILKIPS
jgi:fructose-1,6-bisphosphatase/inositol monophosphatase family enzyme